MKKLLSILFVLISFSAFAQPGSISQSVIRSRVNDSTTINGATASGYGYFLWNNQKAVPSWQFWDGTSLVDWNPSSAGAGTVTSVSGTANRITSTGGATPVIDISGSYVGQASITTLGTISTGTVPGTLVSNTPAGTISATTVQAAIDELDAEKAKLYPLTRTVTASTSGVLADAGGYIEMNSVSPTTITIPPASSVAYADNTSITINNYGAGDVTINPGSGVTLNLRDGSTFSIPQYSVAVVKKITGDEWYVWSGAVPLNAVALTNTRVPFADVSGQLTDDADLTFSGATLTTTQLQIGTGSTVIGHLSATAALNFDLTSVNYQDLTITVTGAADGDVGFIGIPSASVTANVLFTFMGCTTNTVTIRASRIDVASGADPASGTFRATAIKY